MKTWFITGGCGFIGSSLIKKIISCTDDQILILDNLSVGQIEDIDTDAEILTTDNYLYDSSANPSARCRIVVGDISDARLVHKMAANMDKIVHLAANTGVAPSIENPLADCRNNVLGTLNVLEAARQSSKCSVVFASSGAPLGEVNTPPIHEELPAHPVSPYGASKLAGEGYCSAYFRSFGVNTVVLRFGNVYGPGSKRKSSVVAKFIKCALAKTPIEINGTGSQTRDFIYIDDLTNAIAAAAEKNIGGEIFQIATNRESTVNEIFDLLIECFALHGITDVEHVFRDPLVGDVKRNYSDISKAEKLLGWKPEIELSEGLSRTVSYFQDLRNSNREYL